MLTGVSIFGPAERRGGEFSETGKHLVLLFNPVPGLLIEVLIPDLGGEMTEVGKGRDELGVGGVFPGEGLAHNQDVVALPEWIGEVSAGFQSDLRIFSWRLPARRAIVVPVGDVLDGLDFLGESATFRAESGTGSVNPDVFGNDLSSLIDALSDVVSFL